MFVRSWMLACLLAVFCMISVGCKSIDSETKSGVLSNYRSALMLNVAPNDSVTICWNDPNEKSINVAENLKEGISKWAVVILRDGYFTIDTSCNKEAKYKITLEPCSNATTAFTEYALKSDNSARVCYNPTDKTYRNLSTMLHEAGHLWGLCDLYAGPNNCIDHEGIGKDGKAFKDYNAIMGYNKGRTQLTDDDIAGIKGIANFTDLGVNDRWRQVISERIPMAVKLRAMFNRSCKVGIEPANRGVYVFVPDSCSRPAGENTEEIADNQSEEQCSTWTGKLQGGYTVKVTQQQSGYVARPCRLGLRGWRSR